MKARMERVSDHDRQEVPSPPSGERARVRGRIPRYGKHRNRTGTARAFARQLRRSSTRAEKRLWRLLRERRFHLFKFRRQYACGSYFLDFYCPIAKLAVELDGGGHGFPDQRARDEERNRFLAGREIKVLRFWNHQLRSELQSVRFEIWHALMKRTGHEEAVAGFREMLPPHPASGHPLPQGGEGKNSAALQASRVSHSPLNFS